MKRAYFLTVFVPIALLAGCADDPSQPTLRREQSAIADGGTYLLKFGAAGIPADFDAQIAALGGEVVFTHAGAGVGAVNLPSSAAANALVAQGLGVAPDATVNIQSEIGDVDVASVSGEDLTQSPTAPNTAFFYNRQWGMRAIQANAAWAAGKLGSSSVKVAILDTGLDYLHPDLFGRVDLALSRSFLSAAENARVQAAFPGAHPVADLNYHGTHVGSTVASNGLAAAGVTSQTTLVGLKVCTPGTAANGWRGSCPNSGTFQAILFAADNGIPVINMSLGGGFDRRAAANVNGEEISFIETINAVFNYAYDKGTTVIVSAGNDNANMTNNGNRYSTYCDAPHTVCVSATGPATAPAHGVYNDVDTKAPYSNYGAKVTVAAPGGSGRNGAPVHTGWVYQACSGFSLAVPACQARFFDPATGAWSAFVLGVNGTSMAAPHTTGTAALALSVGATNVRSVLTNTADDVGKSGKDPIYGSGRINARRAAGL
jgi:subtilisin family serine protease